MFLENIKEAITSIFSNKMRSVLTMLGIIIGISAVITITTIGNSIQTTLTSTLNSLGGNTVQAYVDARYPEDDADWDTWEYPEMKTSDFVTQEMIDELVEKYPDEFDGIAASEFLGNGQIRQCGLIQRMGHFQLPTIGNIQYVQCLIDAFCQIPKVTEVGQS